MTLAEKTFQQGLTALAQWLRFLDEQERLYQAQLERLRQRTTNPQGESTASRPSATSDAQSAETSPDAPFSSEHEDEWL